MQQCFLDSGYDALVSTADDAEVSIKEFAPDAAVLEIDQERAEDEEKYFALARQLRAPARSRRCLSRRQAGPERVQHDAEPRGHSGRHRRGAVGPHAEAHGAGEGSVSGFLG